MIAPEQSRGVEPLASDLSPHDFRAQPEVGHCRHHRGMAAGGGAK